LLVAANRTCEDYWDRVDTQPMVYSSLWSPSAGHGLGMYADFDVITSASSHGARRVGRAEAREVSTL
jgi:endo-beta-N-acetylglucosaminidase D